MPPASNTFCTPSLPPASQFYPSRFSPSSFTPSSRKCCPDRAGQPGGGNLRSGSAPLATSMDGWEGDELGTPDMSDPSGTSGTAVERQPHEQQQQQQQAQVHQARQQQQQQRLAARSASSDAGMAGSEHDMCLSTQCGWTLTLRHHGTTERQPPL